jgi:wyosine [tRNA(Phe)-imidazoG37] synthetase (radical SAM superfamily)
LSRSRRHVFGPVPSRRLGRSLGVDLVPFKTCSYDCIYCQLGRTTDLTVQRREYVPLEAVLADLKVSLDRRPDYITLSGSGEPTLYSRLGELIAGIKNLTGTPVAVLTNGSLLSDPQVRRELAGADLLIPSLDAGDPQVFAAVNRPHPSIDFDTMVAGLAAMRREFSGHFWLEVFILDGFTSDSAQVEKLVRRVKEVAPERVQLNTVCRPPAEDFANGVGLERLAELAGRFEPEAEVIADFRGVHQLGEFAAGRQEMLDLLRRRPCTAGGIADGLQMHLNAVAKYLEELVTGGLVDSTRSGGVVYYRARGEADVPAATSSRSAPASPRSSREGP